MKWFTILAFTCLCVSFTATRAHAQCAGGVAEGDVHPDNRCQLCDHGVFVALPQYTSCDPERRIQCDGTGAFRVECVADETQPEVTECKPNYRWDACPGGLACQSGICLSTCTTQAECRSDFECRNGTCVALPQPDMGPDGGTADGGTPDGGQSDGGTSDLGQPMPDASTPSDMDPGGDGPATTRPNKPMQDGCCATAAGPKMPAGPLLLLGVLWMWRRRA